MSAVKRTVSADLADLTIADLEEFCVIARSDGAISTTPVRLIETAPFIKRYRLQAICPPHPKEAKS